VLTRRSLLGAGLVIPALAGRKRRGARVTSYRPLPQVAVTATADTTGQNTGNWTNAFVASVLPDINTYEIYRMAVKNAQILGSATITLRNQQFSTVTADFNGANEWDAAQPMVVNAGDEVFYFWNYAASGTAPVVTLWLRFDTDLPQNAYAGMLWAGVNRFSPPRRSSSSAPGPAAGCSPTRGPPRLTG
jgi:hypothetical protein